MTIHLKLKSGTFATARYIKSRKQYRVTHLTSGGPVVGGWFTEHELRHCRRLKNKPTPAQVRKAGWGVNLDEA